MSDRERQAPDLEHVAFLTPGVLSGFDGEWRPISPTRTYPKIGVAKVAKAPDE